MQLGSLVEADEETDDGHTVLPINDIPKLDENQRKLLLRAQEHVLKNIPKFSCLSCDEPSCLPRAHCEDAFQVHKSLRNLAFFHIFFKVLFVAGARHKRRRSCVPWLRQTTRSSCVLLPNAEFSEKPD